MRKNDITQTYVQENANEVIKILKNITHETMAFQIMLYPTPPPPQWISEFCVKH